MEAQLKAFLDSAKVSKGEPFTHTTKSTGSLPGGWSSGSYYIDDEASEAFWSRYCNIIRKNIYPTITEKPGPYGPLRVDFDFKTSLDQGKKRQYTIETLKNIVKIYQGEIREIINDEAFDEKMLWCVVLEKKEPRVEKGEIKDGFHLHFPHFVCEGWIQDSLLRDRVTTKIIEEKIWNGKFTTPIEDFIDKDMAKKPWMMYGSMNHKDKRSTPYLYNRWKNIPEEERYGHVFDQNLDEADMKELFEDEMVGRKNSVRYYLPRFMSIRGFYQASELTPEIEKKRSAHCGRKKRRKKHISKKRRTEDIMADLKLIQEAGIMDMISDDRSDNYDEWMDVGWTLFNIGQGCDESLELWVDFSRRSSKFVEGECEDKWGTMDISDKTIASLLSMAKNDSPDDYKEWKETNVRFYMWKSLSGAKYNEYDVAMVVWKTYGDRFVCGDAKRDIWYQYENHRWNYMDDGVTLKNLILEEIVEKYCEMRHELHEQIGNLEYRMGMAEKESNEANQMTVEHKEKCGKKKRCTEIIEGIKTTNFLEKIVKMCKLKMYNKDFLVKIDENRNLMGHENGVMDLELGIFRDGRPDDYVTFNSGVNYQIYRPDDEEVKELEEYLLKVYPNVNLREYFLNFMASCLQGGNINKRFLIMTGKSDGAKSMTVFLLELVFGSGSLGYFGKFPRELIVQATGRNSSSGARPELSRVRGKRIMGVQEVTSEESINIGFVKESTGNDSFYVRGLYEKGTEIAPQFTMIMQCNERPRAPGHDEALWSRIRVLDHESKFVKPEDREKWPVPKTLEEQLKIKRFNADPSFKERLTDLAPVLLWMLFERFKKIKKANKGIYEPEEVKMATNMYQTDNDIYRQFINDRIEKMKIVGSGEEKEKSEEIAKKTNIRLADAFSEFKDWYSDNYPSYTKDKIGKTKLKHELNSRLGVIHPETPQIYGFGRLNRWWGYRFIPDDDPIHEETTNSLLGKE